MRTARSEAEWHELEAARSDFDSFLHALRTQELRRVEPAGPVFLSAGCSGRWYFDWVRESYRGTIERHIGVEAFAPRPDDLPAEAMWIDDTLDRIAQVGDGSVDVVFAGQVVEHLWPDVLAGFLAEANRVLRPDGILVLDSPERSVTEHVGWTQSEHTVELTATEVKELLSLAGFVDITVRGVWLCRDPSTGLPLPLDPSTGSSWRTRVEEADSAPADSFVWWAESRRGSSPPDIARLTDRCLDHWWAVWPRSIGRIQTQGTRTRRDDADRTTTPLGETGYPLFGPYSPLAPGPWEVEVVVTVDHLDPSVPDMAPVLVLDVCHGDDDSQIASRSVTAGQVRAASSESLAVRISFEVESTLFRWQRRVLSTGIAEVTVECHLTRLRRRDRRIEPVPPVMEPTQEPSRAPAPTTEAATADPLPRIARTARGVVSAVFHRVSGTTRRLS